MLKILLRKPVKNVALWVFVFHAYNFLGFVFKYLSARVAIFKRYLKVMTTESFIYEDYYYNNITLKWYYGGQDHEMHKVHLSMGSSKE